jgi:hypothetical protein
MVFRCKPRQSLETLHSLNRYLRLKLVRECSSFFYRFYPPFLTTFQTQILLKPVVQNMGVRADCSGPTL